MSRSPALLLLDEPTGDLDTLNTIRIMNLLVELNNMGTTLGLTERLLRSSDGHT